MADGTIQIPGGTQTGPNLDTEQLMVNGQPVMANGQPVYRERHRIAGANPPELAVVMNTPPTGNEYGLGVRTIGPVVTTSAAGSQADGHSVSIGTTGDPVTALTVIGRLKALLAALPTTLGQKVMASSLGVTIASDQGNIPVNPSAGAEVALSAPPAALTANADTLLTFASPVRHLEVQNKSGVDIYVKTDAAASQGTRKVYANGGSFFSDLPCTTLHIYSTAATALNGTADSNIFVEGRL